MVGKWNRRRREPERSRENKIGKEEREGPYLIVGQEKCKERETSKKGRRRLTRRAQEKEEKRGKGDMEVAGYVCRTYGDRNVACHVPAY